MMKKLFWIVPLLTLAACGGNQQIDKAGEELDSKQAVKCVTELAVAEPQKAMELIDSLELNGILPSYDVNALRALVYHNGLHRLRLASYYGLKAYNDSIFLLNDPAGWLDNLEVPVSHSQGEKRFADCLRYAYRGVSVAHDLGLPLKEAKFLFYMGLCNLNIENPAEGYKQLLKSISLYEQNISGTSGYADVDDLLFTIGESMNMMTKRGDTDQAIALAPKLLKALELLENDSDATDDVVDMRRAMTYAQLANTYAKAGKPHDARLYESRCGETAFSQTPFGTLLLSDQLLASGQQQRLIEQMQIALQIFTDDHTYRADMFSLMQQAYESLGNHRMALSMADSVIAEKDRASAQILRDDAAQLAVIYQTQEKDALLADRQSSLTIHRLIIAIIATVALLLAFILWRGWYHRRIILRKNKATAGVVNEMLHYKEQAEAVDQPLPDCPDEDSISIEERSFRRLEQIIKSQQLFADPKVTKADVAAAAKIPQYLFSDLFLKYAGTSYKDYMTNLRMEYAARLLRDNDHLTIESIANMCGYSSRQAFYTQFSRKYGLTPMEFKQSLS